MTEALRLPGGTLSMQGNDITIAYATREDAERAFDVLEAALSTAPSGDGDTLASKDTALAEIRADRDAAYKMLVIANAQLADMEFLTVEGFMDRASRSTSTQEEDTK